MATDEAVVIATIDYTSKHGGQPVPIEVLNDGTFRAQIGEVELHADYLDRVRRQIDDTIFGHRIEVPFVNPNGVRGVMRGFHAGTKEVLVTWEDGTKGKLSGYGREVFAEGTLTDDEIAELRGLVQQVLDANAQIKAIQTKLTDSKALLAEQISEDLFDHRRHDAVLV